MRSRKGNDREMHMPLEHSFQHGFRRAYERDRELARRRQRRPIARLIGGSLIVIWGLALLLDNLGLGELRQYADRMWPAVLVIIGITLLIHRDPSCNRYGFWGTVWVFAGVCAYVSQQNWIHASFWALLGPMLLLVFGGSLVYRAFRGPRAAAGTHVNTNLRRPHLD
jgi:cell wall-active antibiotic response 4TMS protein YvqF